MNIITQKARKTTQTLYMIQYIAIYMYMNLKVYRYKIVRMNIHMNKGLYYDKSVHFPMIDIKLVFIYIYFFFNNWSATTPGDCTEWSEPVDKLRGVLF